MVWGGGEGWRNQLTCERNCALPGNRRQFNILVLYVASQRTISRWNFQIESRTRQKAATIFHLPPLSNIRARSIGSTLLIASFRSNEARYESAGDFIFLLARWSPISRLQRPKGRRRRGCYRFLSNAPRFGRNSYGFRWRSQSVYTFSEELNWLKWTIRVVAVSSGF